jgi:hypothetical protein
MAEHVDAQVVTQSEVML